MSRELALQARLADARRPENRDEVWSAVSDRPLPDRSEQLHLAIASDHRRRRPLGRSGDRRDGSPGPDRLLLAFGVDRAQLLVADGGSCEEVCLLAHDELARRRAGLKSRSRVDDVAHGEGLTGARGGADGYDRLSRVHGGASFEAEVLHRFQDLEASPNRALGIVTMGDRGTEDGHDCVADEFLEVAAKR